MIMVAWDYDSYTIDDVNEYVEEFKQNQESIDGMLDDIFDQILPDFPTESDLEHLLGVVMWVIRSGYEVKKNYLITVKKILDELILEGKQKEWCQPLQRKKKLLHERKIIVSIIINKKIPKLKLKKKTKKRVGYINKYQQSYVE